MATVNTRPGTKARTHEGAPARASNPEQELRRAVSACMLWEDQFYEEGEEIAKRIGELVPKVKAEKVAALALEARAKLKLRHVPLLLVREMVRHESHRPLVAKTLADVIQRADELAEFVAIYWKEGRRPLAGQVKKGLARAFPKFSEHQLAKYNRDRSVKLRDVLFLCHPKPVDDAQDAVWKRLVDGKLETPDTWEVALSSGADKRETWERLLAEGKLGALALLRNLRNMREAGVNEDRMKGAIRSLKPERVLPFRFIAAARFAPALEPQLEEVMLSCLSSQEKLPGKTVLLVDVSGSMDDTISSKSDLRRVDAACGLAMLLREIGTDVSVFTFSSALAEVPARRGFALRDAIVSSQPHASTYLGQAIATVNTKVPEYDRIIVITDEQSHDSVSALPKGRGFMVNVASFQHGVAYGPWLRVNGWSEAIVDFVRQSEADQ